MEIIGVTHPIPKKFAKRIYDGKKNVFVGNSFLNKVSKGDKFIIYESRGEGAYTGWADIKKIGKATPEELWQTFNNRLIVTEEEFKIYSKNRKEMNFIEFKNFEKFKNTVKPKKFVTVGGKYIKQKEYDSIVKLKR